MKHETSEQGEKKEQCDQLRKVLNQQYNNLNHKVRSAIEKFDLAEEEKLATAICEAHDTSDMWRKYNQYKKRNQDVVDPVSPLQKQPYSTKKITKY